MGPLRPLWHCDAVQALGRVELDLRGWGVDFASFSAHKVGGPLGVGVLVRDPAAAWSPSVLGGGQEGGLRAGTENSAAIAAAALAIELAVREREQHVGRMRELSAQLWTELSAQVEVELVGPAIDDEGRLANTLNLSFEGVTGHALVARLDLEGLEASVGSACSSGALEPSHVLMAMGRSEQEARSCLRLSLGRSTSHRDINTAVDTLVKTYLATRKV
jgi:cysteine desulfurase